MFSHIGKILTGTSFVFRNSSAVKKRTDSKIDCIFYKHAMNSGEMLTTGHDILKTRSADSYLEAVWTKKDLLSFCCEFINLPSPSFDSAYWRTLRSRIALSWTFTLSTKFEMFSRIITSSWKHQFLRYKQKNNINRISTLRWGQTFTSEIWPRVCTRDLPNCYRRKLYARLSRRKVTKIKDMAETLVLRIWALTRR